MITLSKFLPAVFLGAGIFLILQVIFPILHFQLWLLGQNYNNNRIFISPNYSGSSEVQGVSVKNEDNFSKIISNIKRDTEPPYPNFSLSIPNLKIEDEKVLVDSNDLSKNLAQLPGSALPGEKGNLFISGHSALSPLFSLKKAVFGDLNNLKVGDEIDVSAGGTTFRYAVSEIKIVDPKDLSVINPPEPQGRYISLMTCVPPGLNFKRLVVLGKMI